jgi:mRNA interferase HicA
VKASELRRWLKERGCTFEEGTRHTFAILGDKAVTIPRHPSQEINTKTLHSILKKLGLRMQ